MERIIEPEWLDRLPADDPQARQSRRDIQRLNLLIGHDRFIARALAETFGDHPPEHIVDLGSGNGELMLSVARRLSGKWRNVEVTLVDCVNGFAPALRDQMTQLGWNANFKIADALSYVRTLSRDRTHAVVANHFLHQIEAAELREMFMVLSNSVDAVVAAEPRRGFLPLLFSRLVWLVGSAAVTRYDAPVSVRAGFRGKELSALWPDKTGWELAERRAGLFSHLFNFRRKALPD